MRTLQALLQAINRGTLPEWFINLKTGLSGASVGSAEAKTAISDTLFISVVGESAAGAEPRRLSEFLVAVQICTLALLAVGCRSAPESGFLSKGEEGYLTGAGGVVMKHITTIDAYIKVTAWAVDATSDHSAPQATALWVSTTYRAAELLSEHYTAGCAMLMATREHRRAFLPRITAVPACVVRADVEKVRRLV